MKVIRLFILSFLFCSLLHSESFKTNKHNVQGSVGLDRSHLVLNMNYEYLLSRFSGFGGGFYFTPDDDDSLYPQIFGVGANFTLHQPIEDFDLYFRPGMGIAFVEYENVFGKERDETILSPSLSLGILYRVTEHFSFGIENVNAFIWTEEDFLDDDSNDFLLSFRGSF